jgi:hypothetical protein
MKIRIDEGDVDVRKRKWFEAREIRASTSRSSELRDQVQLHRIASRRVTNTRLWRMYVRMLAQTDILILEYH